jgi:AcrR family transcriptional regulator
VARRGDDARARLVEEAERLFAERGISAVSLRDVSAAAGQRNHSAAQYHYGDRAGLVAAVFETRMRVINERRRVHLARLDEAGLGDDVPGLVAALVEPLVAIVTETGGWYGRFLARVRFDPFASEVVEGLPVADVVRETNGRLHHALADLAPDVRHGRIEKLNTLLIGTVAAWEWARDRGQRRLDAQLMGDELIATGVAVLTAPQLASAEPDTSPVPSLSGASR